MNEIKEEFQVSLICKARCYCFCLLGVKSRDLVRLKVQNLSFSSSFFSIFFASLPFLLYFFPLLLLFYTHLSIFHLNPNTKQYTTQPHHRSPNTGGTHESLRLTVKVHTTHGQTQYWPHFALFCTPISGSQIHISNPNLLF